MKNLKNHAVMMLVSRRVKPGYESEFERIMAQFIEAANNFSGCLGVQLVHPGDEADAECSLYYTLLAFDNPDSLRAWRNSPERSLYLDATAACIEGQAMVRQVTGLAHWFQPPASPSLAPPPRWKVAVATWLVLQL